ncbi:MAG TPA: hypothetical protein VFD70_23245 [Anaerolineae bacterium]|nr:hypothetical protein [Anaerolineae bacterium]
MLLVSNITAVTVDAQRRIVTRAAMAIEGEYIVAVGKAGELQARYPNAERLDGQGMLALPGLIDTHVHSDQAMLRSIADETTWQPFLFNYIFPILHCKRRRRAETR